MKRKKLFGIGAVVLMVLVAFTPAISALQVESEKMNDFSPTYTGGWDLKVTMLEDPEWLHYDDDINPTGSTFRIKYRVENVGDQTYRGRPSTELRKNNSGITIKVWHWPAFPAPKLVLKAGERSDFTEDITIPYDIEPYLAGKEVNLKTGLKDETNSPDPNQLNNVGFGLGVYWNSSEYIPSDNHLDATMPQEDWIEEYDVYNYDGYDPIEIPLFKFKYRGFALPTLISSDRLGWIGEATELLIDLGIAWSNFLKEFFDVCAVIALLAGEFWFGINAFIALCASAATPGGLVLTPELVALIFASLAAVVATFGLLLEQIDQLPVNKTDPLRVALGEASDTFWNYMSTHPWQDGVTIKGSVNNCKSGETVTIDCRDVEDKPIEGEGGTRIIVPFEVNTSWKAGDGLIFRRCQVIIEGTEHLDQILKTPGFLSYCAPQGYLKIISGFKTSRYVNIQFYNFLQRFAEIFPFLKQIFPSLFFQPITE